MPMFGKSRSGRRCLGLREIYSQERAVCGGENVSHLASKGKSGVGFPNCGGSICNRHGTCVHYNLSIQAAETERDGLPSRGFAQLDTGTQINRPSIRKSLRPFVAFPGLLCLGIPITIFNLQQCSAKQLLSPLLSSHSPLAR